MTFAGTKLVNRSVEDWDALGEAVAVEVELIKKHRVRSPNS